MPDGNHLVASEKRLKPLREFRGAAPPEQLLLVYDPDLASWLRRTGVRNLLAQEDAHAGERAGAAALLDGAGPGLAS